jgi:hypothetical protein
MQRLHNFPYLLKEIETFLTDMSSITSCGIVQFSAREVKS